MTRTGAAQLLLLALAQLGTALPTTNDQNVLARPSNPTSQASRKLSGRFLHITDFHPDDFYKPHTTPANVCHKGKGAAGVYGAETTECDSPYSLVNATFEWVANHIKDDVDFVIWTGDSARHDGDENHPRNADEVLRTNRFIADKFVETFSDTTGRLAVPVIPTFGNNDFLPHNIFEPGPNKWLAAYTDIWRRFIPEVQRHSFEFGGWFYVEVIPNKLAVFSLNTMYFFDRNAAVDGCASPSEPGFKHMEWLRVQLQFMRSRGMKAILIGHVPPARTESKQLWDETCWQRYTLWLKQYRDVVVVGLYGHMNIDHFLLGDSKEIDLNADASAKQQRTFLDIEGHRDVSAASKKDYLDELRDQWSGLPGSAAKISDIETLAGKKKKKKFKKIGGKHAERYQLTLVSPSVVPNYFPTLRIFEYNITGLEQQPIWEDSYPVTSEETRIEEDSRLELRNAETEVAGKKKGKKGKKRKKGKGKKPKDPNLTVPDDPDKKDLPGPAYYDQTLTLLSYQQWFANLTHINNEKNGKAKLREFKFEVEYDTKDDKKYKLKDLTVRNLLKLAYKMGKAAEGDALSMDEGKVDTAGKGKKKKGKKKKKKGENKAWLAFLSRAFVGTVADEELKSD